MEIPVYLFTGFLEAGKTKFMQETLADPNFSQNHERTLVLLFEEGEETLDPSGFASPEVYVEVIESESQCNPDKLEALRRKHNADRVLIEYNGMWLLPTLYQAVPDHWIIYQEMMFVDASTFSEYNANMRNLVVDKLSNCELVVFNRCTDETDTEALHKIVRAISRRTDIIYENVNGSFAYDEIEDPLPFDVNADTIVIENRDFALWYRDMSENMDQYEGKTVVFTGFVTKNAKVPADGFVIGRQIMTCCEADITYSGLFCENAGHDVKKGTWARLTATLTVKDCRLYGKRGPVLHAVSIEAAEQPDSPVATFY